MSRKVGRITVAAALIVAGVAILLDNILGTQLTWYAAHLWPALLIGMGLEWLAGAARAQADGSKPAADGGAVVVMIIVALVAANYANWNRGPFFGGMPHISRVEVRTFSPPTPPDPPFIPFVSNVPAEAVQTQNLALNQVKELLVTATSGEVTVQDGPAAKVELHVKAWGVSTADAEAKARQVPLLVEPQGSRTVVHSLSPLNDRTEIAYTITLPQNAAVNLNITATSGNVNVSDRAGNVTVATSSGTVRVDSVDGNLAANASSGRVEAQSVRGDVKVGTASGPVVLTDVGGKVDVQTSSGGVTIQTGTVGGDYTLGTASGAVALTVPESAPIAVQAKALSGTVAGPSWLTLGEGRNSGTGTQGAGTYKVSIRTNSGDIRVETR